MYKVLKHITNNTYGKVSKSNVVYERDLPYLFSKETILADFEGDLNIEQFSLVEVNLIENQPIIADFVPKIIGTLTKVLGIQGYPLANIGDDVWEEGDKYFVMMGTHKTSYYKETLKPYINESKNII